MEVIEFAREFGAVQQDREHGAGAAVAGHQGQGFARQAPQASQWVEAIFTRGGLQRPLLGRSTRPNRACPRAVLSVKCQYSAPRIAPAAVAMPPRAVRPTPRARNGCSAASSRRSRVAWTTSPERRGTRRGSGTAVVRAGPTAESQQRRTGVPFVRDDRHRTPRCVPTVDAWSSQALAALPALPEIRAPAAASRQTDARVCTLRRVVGPAAGSTRLEAPQAVTDPGPEPRPTPVPPQAPPCGGRFGRSGRTPAALGRLSATRRCGRPVRRLAPPAP